MDDALVDYMLAIVEKTRRHEALALGVERILLDNMPLEKMAEAVRLTGDRAKLEASGNVTLETVGAIARAGVDFISSGALTHSAKVFDVSFDYLDHGS